MNLASRFNGWSVRDTGEKLWFNAPISHIRHASLRDAHHFPVLFPAIEMAG
jgi:hypothetical protein